MLKIITTLSMLLTGSLAHAQPTANGEIAGFRKPILAMESANAAGLQQFMARLTGNTLEIYPQYDRALHL